MADFLANLAARSLGQLPSVMPRRASRFEPIAEALEERVEDIAVERSLTRPATPMAETMDSGTKARITRSDPAPVDPRTVKASPPVTGVTPAPPTPAPDDDLPELAIDRAEDREARSEPPAPHHDQPTRQFESRPRADVRHDAAQEPTFAPAASSPHRDDAREADASADARRSPEDPSQPAITAPPLQGKAVFETSTAAPNGLGVVEVGRHVLATQRIDESPAPMPTIAPATAPRITVTIGRIEVKAPPAPAPQPSPAAPSRAESPRMSLDDYLRRGPRGRR
jgi:hypothetical protein